MAKIFDADSDAWYEPGQLPPLPQAAPVQRALQLDPALGMLPMIPGYQPPEEQNQQRPLGPLPPVPSMKLNRPAMRPPAPYAPPSLDLGPIPGLGGMPALTTPPKDLAGALQAMPPTPPAAEGFSWEGQSGRKFELTPEQGARLRAGYADMQKRMGGSLGPPPEESKDPAGAASGLMATLSEFMEPEKAAQLALSVHSGELNRLSAEERAQAALDARAKRGSGSGSGAPGFNLKTSSAASQAQQRILSSANTQFSLPKAREAQSKIRMAMSAANLDSGLGDETAFRGLVSSLHGLASSNRELQGMQDTAGKIDQWIEQAKGVFMKERRLPPALMDQLRSVLDVNAQMVQSKIDAGVSFVRERAKNDPILVGLGRADSDAKWMGDATAIGTGTDGGGSPDGGGVDPDKELEELLR